MALTVTNITKEIMFPQDKGKPPIILPFPEGMTPGEAQVFYSKQYPELTTAIIEGPEVKKGKATYTFKKSVGTKG